MNADSQDLDRPAASGNGDLIRWLVAFGLVAAVCVGVPAGCVYAMKFAERHAKEQKGMDWICGGIEIHVRDRDGEWPRNWDEVWASVEKLDAQHVNEIPASEEELRSLIAIDYEVDVDEVCGSPPERRVVWPVREGPHGRRNDHEERLLRAICDEAVSP